MAWFGFWIFAAFIVFIAVHVRGFRIALAWIIGIGALVVFMLMYRPPNDAAENTKQVVLKGQ